ncbi:MAG: beta-galactosidase [Tepidisphaerales bacterium]
MLFLLTAAAARGQGAADAKASYPAYQFDPAEGWRVSAAGAGATSLTGRSLHLDFSKGASAVSLKVPDRSLLTRPAQLRLRVRGSAKGHPLEISMRTHFMTFHKVVGELKGEGEQELAIAMPPGEGWQWHSGENDGKIHGPLRIGEIRFLANGNADQADLELLGITVDGRCPADKMLVMTADAQAEKPAFRAELRSLLSAPAEAALTWTILDWQRNELGKGSRKLELPPAGKALAVDIPSDGVPAGLKFVETRFELTAPGQQVAPVHAYWVAPMPAREDAKLQPESPFGMGVYLGRYGKQDMEEVARKARDAGVKWSREDFAWSRIEPQPGKFTWDYYDGLLDCANRNGITVYAIVGYWTPWSKQYTSEGVDQYVTYLRQLVARYKGRINQWEIWNEPNIFFWQGPKELYAELLKKSYAAIKEVDPSAQVLGISTAGIDRNFIDKMLKLGAPFDVLTIHPYRTKYDDDAFISDLMKVSDQVKLPDGKRRPVWLTEMGWATHTPHHVLGQDFQPVSQRTQAELIARVYLASIVSGIDPRTFWYDFRNDGDDPFYFEHNMGIMRRDGRPKPSYRAYAVLAETLDGMKYDALVDAGDGNMAYRFVSAAGTKKQVLAIWNAKADATVDVKVPPGRVKIVNSMGETAEKEAATGSVVVTLNACAAVYVVTE